MDRRISIYRGIARTAVVVAVVVTGITTISSVFAEVVARTDRNGDYVSTQVFAKQDPLGEKVWARRGRTARALRYAVALNPDGDRNGDLAPAIGEADEGPYASWVVWSRFNGGGYDLAFSRWDRGDWSAIDWVAESATETDELDPRIGIASNGTPYIAWWSEVEGVGSVYVSRFLETRWLTAFEISLEGVNARHPELFMGYNDVLYVQYQTDEGSVIQTIRVTEPGTITDDINPVGLFELYGRPGPTGIGPSGTK